MYTKVSLAWGWDNEIEKVEEDKPRKRKRNEEFKKKMQNPDDESQTGHGRF